MASESDVLPELLASEDRFEGRLFRISVDHIRFADGTEAARETLHHPGAVCMVPVDGDGRVVMVTQYRHPARARLLELPAGTLEPGEQPGAAVERELREEIGLRPGHLEPLGGFYVAPGYATEYIHLFVCSDLTPAPLDGDDDEDIAVHRLTLDEALTAIEEGRIVDGKTIIGVLRWARRQGG